jgi:hypothetical protein
MNESKKASVFDSRRRIPRSSFLSVLFILSIHLNFPEPEIKDWGA